MIILFTQRLHLRTWTLADIEPMTAVNADPEVCKYLPSIGNRATTKTMVERFIKHYEEHGFCLYVVETKDTQQFLGFVGLNIPAFAAHFTPTVEIGWRLGSQYWNQGYATEAAKAALHFGFTKINLKEIVAFTTKDNNASKRIMEKIGMHYNSDDDFDHPGVAKSSQLCRHVLYRLSKTTYLKQLEKISSN